MLIFTTQTKHPHTCIFSLCKVARAQSKTNPLLSTVPGGGKKLARESNSVLALTSWPGNDGQPLARNAQWGHGTPARAEANLHVPETLFLLGSRLHVADLGLPDVRRRALAESVSQLCSAAVTHSPDRDRDADLRWCQSSAVTLGRSRARRPPSSPNLKVHRLQFHSRVSTWPGSIL